MTTTQTYSVPDISCEHCVTAITDQVTQVPGVEMVDVNIDAKTVQVAGGEHSAIVAAIDEAGYAVESSSSGRIAARAEVQVDNGILRSTKWTFPPGSETGHHVHEYEFVVVPIQGGDLTIESHTADTFVASIVPGVSYTRAKGVAHNVANDTDATISFVEVELIENEAT